MNRAAQLRYSDILHDLRGVDDWLRALNVPVHSMDRAHYAIQKLERAQQAFVDGTDHAAGVSKSDYLFALTEALELRDVYCAFKDHPPDQLCDKLTRALSGPSLPQSETAKNRDARNIMFELALGAEWALLGGNVEFTEPDLVLKATRRSYLVACKRPENEHGIRAAVRNAASQLRLALSRTSIDRFGIVAVSLSRVLSRGDTYFSGTYEQLSELLNGLMNVHRSDWCTTDFHARNIAVLFYASTPADWGDGLYRLSAIRIVQAQGEYNESHRNLESDLTELYARPGVAPGGVPQNDRATHAAPVQSQRPRARVPAPRNQKLAARKFRAAWTAEGGCPHMNIGGASARSKSPPCRKNRDKDGAPDSYWPLITGH